MAKIKLTKSELKKQRDSLKQFKRYLPTLQLKKQQLQMKINEARNHLHRKQAELNDVVEKIKLWSGLLGEAGIDFQDWLMPEDIVTGTVNIAGATVPVFEDIRFKDVEYDLYSTPFWLDGALDKLKKMIGLTAEVEIIRMQIHKLELELRATSQRVNLFEKVKIPECGSNIRKIRIYLGDQQANAVGVSKVAKKKVETRNEEAALV